MVRGCHVIAKGVIGSALNIVPSILAHGLQINQSLNGIAAWAYYADMVLMHQASKPIVVFDVDDALVEQWAIHLPQRSDFAIMRMPGKLLDYVPITVLGFLNLPPSSNIPTFLGSIGIV